MENIISENTNSLRFIPISSIFEQKIVSPPTFYKNLKEGKYKLYKMGNRSYVDKEEFEGSFQVIDFAKK